MATRSDTILPKKPVVLGRSAASGQFVIAPVAGKTTVSDRRIAAAVKRVLAKK